ncbi:MAG: efflux transporter periplasmic adaptor subunit, partial [Belnapia sp.]|nr:efflux transporter periplasmic adaptor subunit [Belnapia sp.]
MPDHGFTDQTALLPGETAGRRRFGGWRAGLLAALAMAGLAAAIVYWPRPVVLPPAAGTAPEAPPALTVALAPVLAETLARPAFGDGSVVAWQEWVVGIEAGGLRILEVPVEEGEKVRR